MIGVSRSVNIHFADAAGVCSVIHFIHNRRFVTSVTHNKRDIVQYEYEMLHGPCTALFSCECPCTCEKTHRLQDKPFRTGRSIVGVKKVWMSVALPGLCMQLANLGKLGDEWSIICYYVLASVSTTGLSYYLCQYVLAPLSTTGLNGRLSV